MADRRWLTETAYLNQRSLQDFAADWVRISYPLSAICTQMIVDCFPFFDELDLLEIRLEELDSVVDRFIIAEAPLSFRGKPKPLYFAENASRFKPFVAKIEHLVVEFPETEDGWVREDCQRNALKRGIERLPPDAAVFISDVDEIFRPCAMVAAAERKRFTFLELDLFLYFMNLKRKAPNWVKAYCAPAREILRMDNFSHPRWQEHRYLQERNLPADSVVSNGGWHFTWLGGLPGTLKKLDVTNHTEMRPWLERTHEIAAAVAKGETFFLTGEELEKVATEDLPLAVQKRLRYLQAKGLFWKPQPWYRRLGQRMRQTTP